MLIMLYLLPWGCLEIDGLTPFIPLGLQVWINKQKRENIKSVFNLLLVGMPNVNLLARPVHGDTLFESMRRAVGDRCSLDPLVQVLPPLFKYLFVRKHLFILFIGN
jgi:hypothetical protein